MAPVVLQQDPDILQKVYFMESENVTKFLQEMPLSSTVSAWHLALLLRRKEELRLELPLQRQAIMPGCHSCQSLLSRGSITKSDHLDSGKE